MPIDLEPQQNNRISILGPAQSMLIIDPDRDYQYSSKAPFPTTSITVSMLSTRFPHNLSRQINIELLISRFTKSMLPLEALVYNGWVLNSVPYF